MKNFLLQNKRAFMGGLISTCFIGLCVFILGNISGYEAKKLLEAAIPGINLLSNTIILASATILALLLTLLGISSGVESKLKKQHYYEVLNIAKIDTILFISVLVLFQLFNLPITEAENVPTHWFKIIYWSALFCSSVISGSMVIVILMLYNTVSNIIQIVGLGNENHRLINTETENKVASEDENPNR